MCRVREQDNFFLSEEPFVSRRIFPVTSQSVLIWKDLCEDQTGTIHGDNGGDSITGVKLIKTMSPLGEEGEVKPET